VDSGRRDRRGPHGRRAATGRRPDAPGPLAQLEALRDADNYRLSTLTPEVVLASHQLSTIPDIFDRLIVAEARERRLPLLTRDALIRESGLVGTVWD
jgi:PIN domain nuclease of toxin-antitoxin system